MSVKTPMSGISNVSYNIQCVQNVQCVQYVQGLSVLVQSAIYLILHAFGMIRSRNPMKCSKIVQKVVVGTK